MRLFPSARILVPTLFLAACADKGASENGSGTTDPNGTTDDSGDPGPSYDEGCILVDGAGGYAWITDAIEVASEGSVIELCAGEGVHEERVVVNKGVTIQGPGSDQLVLQAPTNEYGISITASNVTLSGVTLSTSRTGARIAPEEAGATLSDITLSDVAVETAGNWGISVEKSEAVVLENVLLRGNTEGGLSVDQAEVTLQDSIVESNIAYGVFATAGGQVTIAGSAIVGTLTSDETSYPDGHGVYATDGASIISMSSEYVGNAFVNVFADDADLSMTDDILNLGLYNIAAILGDVTLDGLTVTDGYFHGIYVVTPQPVSMTNLMVSGSETNTVNVPDATWNADDGSGNANQNGTALFLAGDDILLSDSTIEGYNNAGAFVVPYEGGRATLARVQFVDNGRHGIYSGTIGLTLEDVSVTGLKEREPEDISTACLTVDRHAAAVFIDSSVLWTGGEIQNNEGYGITGIRSAVSISGADVAANGCAGVMNFNGSLVAVGNTFRQASPVDIDNQWITASIVDYMSAGATISDNAFSENQRERVYEGPVYDYGTYTTQYVYYDTTGLDIVSYQSAPLEITDNVFVDGTYGTQVISTAANISDNTWQNYRMSALELSGEFTFDVSGNTFSEVAGSAVACELGQAKLSDNEFRNGTEYEYAVEYYYDGELSFSYTSSYIGRAVGLSGCSLSMDGDSIENFPTYALYSYAYSDSYPNIELVDVTIDRVNTDPSWAYQAAIYAYTYYGETDILLDGVSITNVENDGAIEIVGDFGSDSYPGTTTLTILDSEIDTVAGYGLFLQGDAIETEIDSTTIQNIGADAIRAIYGADISLTTVNIADVGTSGISIASGSTVTGDATLPSSITNAGTYGMTCDSTVEVVACDALDLSGNIAGSHNGCDAWCGPAL